MGVVKERVGKKSRITHRFLTWKVKVKSSEKQHTEICKEEKVSNDSPRRVFVHQGLGILFQIRTPELGGVVDYTVKNWHLYFETPAFPF